MSNVPVVREMFAAYLAQDRTAVERHRNTEVITVRHGRLQVIQVFFGGRVAAQ